MGLLRKIASFLHNLNKIQTKPLELLTAVHIILLIIFDVLLKIPEFLSNQIKI